MRRHPFAPHFALALALGLAASARVEQAARAQGEDGGGEVRGAFRNTRPGANRAGRRDANAPPETAQRAKPAGAKISGGAHGGGGKKESLAKAGKPNGPAAEVKPSAPSGVGPLIAPAVSEEKPPGIALGYTLFMRAPTGEAVRVSNTREFKSGDSVRLLIETNTDGYLYIFNAENDRNPLMIFPNAKLQRGANFIRAHVPYEIPSSAESDERLRWLSFDDRPAVERVYFVVARKPLEDVPSGETLVKWCAESSEDSCAWSPKQKQWDAIRKSMSREQVATSRAADEGRAETPAEHEAATRGLGLPADAPLPSVIYMITSANAEILVATVDLIHR
jgi:hypothetical protein